MDHSSLPFGDFREKRKQKKEEKIKSLYKKTASEFWGRKNLDGNILTVTRVEIPANSRVVKIFYSIYPEKYEEAASVIVENSKNEAQKYFASKIKMRYTPRVEFHPDKGEKLARKIDDILKNDEDR